MRCKYKPFKFAICKLILPRFCCHRAQRQFNKSSRKKLSSNNQQIQAQASAMAEIRRWHFVTANTYYFFDNLPLELSLLRARLSNENSKRRTIQTRD